MLAPAAELAFVAYTFPIAHHVEREGMHEVLGFPHQLQILRVLDTHVRKQALIGPELALVGLGGEIEGDSQGDRVGRECFGGSAEHVARELVEQDDQRDRSFWQREPSLSRLRIVCKSFVYLFAGQSVVLS